MIDGTKEHVLDEFDEASELRGMSHGQPSHARGLPGPTLEYWWADGVSTTYYDRGMRELCVVCGKEFTPSKKNPKETCSKQCQDQRRQWIRSRNVGIGSSFTDPDTGESIDDYMSRVFPGIPLQELYDTYLFPDLDPDLNEWLCDSGFYPPESDPVPPGAR